MNEGKPIEVLSEPVKEAIMKNVRRRMTPQPVKIRADVELTCFAYDGVLALQVHFHCMQMHCKLFYVLLPFSSVVLKVSSSVVQQKVLEF